MADLTKQEEVERARKSIELAEERLAVINQRLPELEKELEDIVLRNEIHGYKGKTIQKVEAEIDGLQKEKSTLERTVEVLKKRLPELEKAARVEVASTETVSNYQKAHSVFIEFLKGIPSLDPLKAEIEKIRQYREALEENQGRFFDLLQTVNDVLIKEDLQSIGDVSIETLRNNKDSVDYQGLLALSDNLIDANETLNNLQYQIFKIGIAQVEVKNYLHPYVNEVCSCGLHRREFIPGENCWTMWENKQSAIYFDKWEWTIIHRDGGFDRKPEFPCEIKSTLEFSPCGRFQIVKGISRWTLLQKVNGHWSEISKTKEKPTFPGETVAVPREEKKTEPAIKQVVYGNKDKVRDPDKSI